MGGIREDLQLIEWPSIMIYLAAINLSPRKAFILGAFLVTVDNYALATQNT